MRTEEVHIRGAGKSGNIHSVSGAGSQAGYIMPQTPKTCAVCTAVCRTCATLVHAVCNGVCKRRVQTPGVGRGCRKNQHGESRV
jgi:hypothetical protein